jgi:hypothetical protein
MIESVKKILRRKSGVLNALPNADNKLFSF